MAVEGTTHSSGVQACTDSGLYIAIVIAVLCVFVCIGLAAWIYNLKRRQNGYSTIFGNDEELRRYKAMFENERKEKEDALKRLSKLMSDRLTDDNPNIANLADMKRPTKLAEEFSELYDNAWTEAYDNIGGEEKEKIGFLLQILKISFEWCRDQADDQLAQLNSLLSYPGQTYDKSTKKPDTVDKDLKKAFKDERKRLAGKTCTYVSKTVFEKLEDEFRSSKFQNELLMKEVKEYCKYCAELSWYFAVQDPAMDIQFSSGKKENFKAYTKSGYEFDFIVWPPLYLHSGGSLMEKGIAQFR